MLIQAADDSGKRTDDILYYSRLTIYGQRMKKKHQNTVVRQARP